MGMRSLKRDAFYPSLTDGSTREWPERWKDGLGLRLDTYLRNLLNQVSRVSYCRSRLPLPTPTIDDYQNVRAGRVTAIDSYLAVANVL